MNFWWNKFFLFVWSFLINRLWGILLKSRCFYLSTHFILFFYFRLFLSLWITRRLCRIKKEDFLNPSSLCRKYRMFCSRCRVNLSLKPFTRWNLVNVINFSFYSFLFPFHSFRQLFFHCTDFSRQHLKHHLVTQYKYNSCLKR